MRITTWSSSALIPALIPALVALALPALLAATLAAVPCHKAAGVQ